MGLIKKARNFIIEILFPIECLGCGLENTWLCQNCFQELESNKQQCCPECKQKNNFGEYCEKCLPKKVINGIWVASDYNNVIVEKLIKTFKYHFAQDLENILGSILYIYLKNTQNNQQIKLNELHNGVNWRRFENIKKAPKILFNLHDSLVIPVPLHKKRLRWRGFNQSEVLADHLAKKLNLQINKDLIRIKHKKPQAKLSRTERKENIKNCFKWKGENLNNKNILIIDDISTTGSTLNECAKVLKEAGAREVWGLVVARG